MSVASNPREDGRMPTVADIRLYKFQAIAGDYARRVLVKQASGVDPGMSDRIRRMVR